MVSLLLPRVNMFDPSMMMSSQDMDFKSQQNEFVQGCAGFAAGATAAVIIRLFARWQKSTSLSYDDLAIALSLIPLWALAGNGIGIALHGGLGMDASMLTPSQAAVFYPSAFASYILYGLAITAAKFSILLLYHRIFTSSSFRKYIYGYMTVCGIWCILVILLAIFRCSPISAAWQSIGAVPEATCIRINNLYYGTALSNLVLDIVINLLPARQIWCLQLPLRQRILLICCMCLGIVSIAAGIGRVLTIPSLSSENLPSTIAMPYLFVIVEPAFAIICACLPTYRPLAIWFGKRLSSSRAGTKVKSLLGTSQAGSSAMSSQNSNAKSPQPARNHRRSTWFGHRCPSSPPQMAESREKYTRRAYPIVHSPALGEKKGLLATTSVTTVSERTTPEASPSMGNGHWTRGGITRTVCTAGSLDSPRAYGHRSNAL